MKERCNGGTNLHGASKLPYEGGWYRITHTRSLRQNRRDRHIVFVISGISMLMNYLTAGNGTVLSTNSILPSASKW